MILNVAFLVLKVLAFTVAEDSSCEELDPECYQCIIGNVQSDGCDTCECLPVNTEDDLRWGSTELTSDQAGILENGESSDDDGTEVERAGTTSSTLKWDNQLGDDGFYTIPYFLDDNLIDLENRVDVIQRAISALYAQTCIRFEPAEIGDKSIVKFKKASGCSSFIGRKKNSIRTVSGCSSVGSVLREFMHILGFWKETSRRDRSRYVAVLTSNIRYDKLKLFAKVKANDLAYYGSTYDVTSITHYGGYAFTSNGRPTIIDKSTKQPVVRNRWALSYEDIKQIKKMYSCSGIRGVNETTTCYNTVDRGLTYRGTKSVTEYGYTCQKWKSQSPHKHNIVPGLLTASDLDKNYCRNPDMRDKPWCYTTSSSMTWDYCNITVCSDSEELPIPEELESVRGFWGDWSNYTECTQTCGMGYKYSVRRCFGSEPGSDTCPGSYFRYKECSIRSSCEDYIYWRQWEEWSECDVECSNGTQTRIRVCQGGNAGVGSCIGNTTQTRYCDTGVTCPLYEGGDCYNTSNTNSYRGTIAVDNTGNVCIDWSSSNTSPSKFPTKDLVSNYCRNPKGKSQPYCHWKKKKTNLCTVPQCNLLANWDDWGNWSSCSETCGEGIEVRTRKCLKGGLGEGWCLGSVLQTRPCNISCAKEEELEEPETRPFKTTTPSPYNCVDFANPRSYRGTAHETLSGFECQPWDAQYPWPHNYTQPQIIRKYGLLDNYCRTPNEDDIYPWCFVENYLPRWEYCDIEYCPYT